MRPDAVFERLKTAKQFGLLFSDHLDVRFHESGRLRKILHDVAAL